MSGRHAPEPGRLRPALFAVLTLVGVVLLVRATADGPSPGPSGSPTSLVAPEGELTLSPSGGPPSGPAPGGTPPGVATPSGSLPGDPAPGGPTPSAPTPAGIPSSGPTPSGPAPGGTTPPGGGVVPGVPSVTVIRRVVIVPRSSCRRFVETELIRTEAEGRTITITLRDSCR